MTVQKNFAAARTVFLLFCTVATAVAIGGRVFEDKNNNQYYTTLWGFRDEYGRYFRATEMDCTDIASRLKGSAGTAITAAAFQFFATIASFADLFMGNNIGISYAITALHVLSLALVTIAWALALSTYTQGLCGPVGDVFVPADRNMKLGWAVPLLIASFSVQFLFVSITHFGSYATAAATEENKAVDEEPAEATAEESAEKDVENGEIATEEAAAGEEGEATAEEQGATEEGEATAPEQNAPDAEAVPVAAEEPVAEEQPVAAEEPVASE